MLSKTATDGEKIYFIWYAGQIIAEIKGNGSVTNNYYYGLERIQSSKFGYYLHDAHGDVIGLVNTAGVATKSYSYDANGNEKNPSSSDLNSFRYCGEYFDGDTKLYYLRARWYDPSVGEFLTVDPVRDGYNWYVYCSNNPVKRIDPSGLKDYIFTSKTEFYIENDKGFWEFLNEDRYYAEINEERYLANSLETITLYDWNEFDVTFTNDTLDSLIQEADKKQFTLKRIINESVGGELDFKLQLSKEQLYLANGKLYNRNEDGNFMWAYYLESKGYGGNFSGALAQGGSLLPPIKNMDQLPRFDETWDKEARWDGIKHYYVRNNSEWLFYMLYFGRNKA